MISWTSLKLKAFALLKTVSKELEDKPLNWEKIFAKDISDKGLLSKIFKELVKLNHNKTKI